MKEFLAKSLLFLLVIGLVVISAQIIFHVAVFAGHLIGLNIGLSEGNEGDSQKAETVHYKKASVDSKP